MPKSLPYHPFLIESLKKPIDSAMYLEAFFEEENPEAELLKMVLSNVAEALGKQQMSPEQYELDLKNWMNCFRSKEVMRFIIWELG
jgi:hypothetical protein